MYHLIKSIHLHLTAKPEYSILVLGLDNAGKTTLLNQIKNIYGASLPPSTTTNNALSSLSTSAPPTKSPGDTVPTVGQNLTLLSLPTLYLKLWDVGGQQSLRQLWSSYYSSCHAIIFVVDSTDVGDGVLPSDYTGIDRGTRPAASTDIKTSNSETTRSGHSRKASTVAATANESGGGRLRECADVLESILRNKETSGVPLLVLANKQDAEDCVEVVRIKEGLVRRVFESEVGGEVRDSRVLPVSALTGKGVREAVEWVRVRVGWNREGRPPVMR